MHAHKDGGCFLVPLEEQMVAFLVSISAGCLAAFCFDVYKTLTRYLRLKKIGLGVGDIFFWVILAGVVFVLLLLSNGGQMRGFMLIGLALGVGVYNRVLGVQSPRVINKIFELTGKTFILVKKVFVGTWVVITTPVKFACFVIAWPFKFIALLLRKIVKFISLFLSRFIPAGMRKAGRKIVFPLVALKTLIKKKKK